jgi:cytochrome P450
MEGSAFTFIFDGLMPWLGPTGLGAKLPGPAGDAHRAMDAWTIASRQMVREYLQKAAKDEDDDAKLLSPYKDRTDAYLGRPLDLEGFVEEAMGIMFARTGTTSSTLTYLLYALALPENQAIQSRHRQEMLGWAMDLASLRKVPYLNAVIKETFRLYPTIISTLPRILDQPLHVGDVTLPPGTVVGMQTYVHHRDPAVFPQPESFLPERWL